jgi:hypothetical protein
MENTIQSRANLKLSRRFATAGGGWSGVLLNFISRQIQNALG